MKIAIGSDHAGFEYKEKLKEYFEHLGQEVSDFGCFSSESCDYPDYAYPLAKSVANGDFEFGILICGTGIGMSIVANKVKGIRAANCCSVEMAKLARQHNNSNIITLGARLIPLELGIEIVNAFLNEHFEGNRHERRISKIHHLTGS